MLITVTVVGPFEEEEEGTGITSDLVKVKGEDPATPGLLPKGIDPGTVTIPQYRVNKTKQNTQRQYKSFPNNRFCQVEMKKTTRLSNETNNA